MQSIDLDQAAAEIEARRQRWTDAGFTVGPLTWSEGQGRPWVSRLDAPNPYSVGVECIRGTVELTMVLFAPPWVDMAWLDILGGDIAPNGREIESDALTSPTLPPFVGFSTPPSNTGRRPSVDLAQPERRT